MDFSLERPAPETSETAPRRGLSRPLIAALIGVVIVAAALVFVLTGALLFGVRESFHVNALTVAITVA